MNEPNMDRMNEPRDRVWNLAREVPVQQNCVSMDCSTLPTTTIAKYYDYALLYFCRCRWKKPRKYRGMGSSLVVEVVVVSLIGEEMREVVLKFKNYYGTRVCTHSIAPSSATRAKLIIFYF